MFPIYAALFFTMALLVTTAAVARMVVLRAKLIAEEGQALAIRRFRQVHSAALAVNLAQLVLLVWGVTQISL